MPDIDPALRAKKEQALASIMRRALRADKKRLIAAMGNPPNVANIPPELWDKVRANIARRSRAALALLFLMGSDNLRNQLSSDLPDFEIDADRAGDKADKYAERQGRRLARQSARTLRNRLRVAARDIRLKLRGDNPPARGTVEQLLKRTVNDSADVQGEAAGITETTAAHTAGERHVANEVERDGGRMTAFWRTEEDERVCEICMPLNWVPEDNWPEELETGPPAHVNCRCWVEYHLVAAPGDYDIDEKPDDEPPLDTRVGWVSPDYGPAGGWGTGDFNGKRRTLRRLWVKKCGGPGSGVPGPCPENKLEPPKANVPPERQLPSGFHSPGFATGRPTDIPQLKPGMDAPSWSPPPRPPIPAIESTDGRGHIDYRTGKRLVPLGEYLHSYSDKSYREQLNYSMSGVGTHAEGARRIAAMPEVHALLDADDAHRAEVETQREAMEVKGYVRGGGDFTGPAFQALEAELRAQLGEPDQSSLSEAKYFFTPNGRSIRLATHPPVYNFEDSGVGLLPGVRESDVPLGEADMFDPKAVVKWAIEQNSKLAPTDVPTAVERVRKQTRAAIAADARKDAKRYGKEAAKLERQVAKYKESGKHLEHAELAKKKPEELKGSRQKQAVEKYGLMEAAEKEALRMRHALAVYPGDKASNDDLFNWTKLTRPEAHGNHEPGSIFEQIYRSLRALRPATPDGAFAKWGAGRFGGVAKCGGKGGKPGPCPYKVELGGSGVSELHSSYQAGLDKAGAEIHALFPELADPSSGFKGIRFAKITTPEHDSFEHEVRLPSYNADKFPPADVYTQGVRPDFTGTVVHELGHAVDYNIKKFGGDELKNEWHAVKKRLETELGSPSEYGKKRTGEWFAERLTAEVFGDQPRVLIPVVQDFLKRSRQNLT